MKSWSEAKEDLEATTLFLVNRAGPTVYQIKDEEDNSARVLLGATHSCTCKEKGFCMHILFVLTKVLRIPLNNPLSQKSGFTDSEIDVALAGNFNVRVVPKRQHLIKKKTQIDPTGTSNDENTVDRQILSEEEEEICPICQDSMKKEHALTWCRRGCGNNIHAKCMKMYAQYKSANKNDILCPLCRDNWGPMAIHVINDDCKGRASLKKACANVTCQSCTFPIRGDFTRCVECSLYGVRCSTGSSRPQQRQQQQSTHADDETGSKPVDFCKTCFKNIGRAHAKHHFMRSTTNASVRDFFWEHARNPRAPQQLVTGELLASLQNRDLTTEDYYFLLDLDESQHMSVQDIIINSMPRCVDASGCQCWCGDEVSSNSNSARILACGHAAHVECCRVKLNEAIEEGFWKLEEMKCFHLNCSFPLFSGLGRRRKRVAAVEGAAYPVAPSVPLFSDFAISGAGLSAQATGMATPLYNEQNEHMLLLQAESSRRSSADYSPVPQSGAHVIRSGRLLPPRQSARGGGGKPSGAGLAGMRRGLALSGRSDSFRRREIEETKSAVVVSHGLNNYVPQGSVNSCTIGSHAVRSTSATDAGSRRGTSSFASARSMRREAARSECVSDADQRTDVQRGLLVSAWSASALMRSSSSGAAAAAPAPVGMVVPDVPPSRTRVSRIRGISESSLRASPVSVNDGNIQLCLNVNHYSHV